MAGTTVAIFDDDDPEDRAVDRASKLKKQRQRMRQAYKDGGLDVLEQFVPGILDSIARSQELLPKLFDLVDDAISSKDTQALKDAAPMVKMLLDENKRLMDRRFGTSVQRSQTDMRVKHEHVSLRDLMSQRRTPSDPTPDAPPADEHVVDAEEIPEP